MNLPPSFLREGFVQPGATRTKIKLPNGQMLKPLLIGTEGKSDTGKTEFLLSIPGNGQLICVDRNFSGVFDNPEPPECRNPKVGIKVIPIPLEGTSKLPVYQEYYTKTRDSLYTALDNPDSHFVALDGDSDFWELHLLAHFGKTRQIFPQTKYTDVYVEKRAQLARAFDSGKIVVFTNKVTDEYVDVLDDNGNPVVDPQNPKDTLRKKSGNDKAQGFKDQDYLYQVRLVHLFRPAEEKIIKGKRVLAPKAWGIRIKKAKHNKDMEGCELWGEECCFRGLVTNLWPDVDPRRWGFDK